MNRHSRGVLVVEVSLSRAAIHGSEMHQFFLTVFGLPRVQFHTNPQLDPLATKRSKNTSGFLKTHIQA